MQFLHIASKRGRLQRLSLAAVSFGVATVMSLTAASCAFADDAGGKSFKDSMDTFLSMEYQKTKEEKRGSGRCLAVYKVLDVQKSDGEIVPEPGDLIELSFACDKDQKATSKGTQDWAELKPDGMLQMHIPKSYIRKRGKTSAETIWRIDNKDNSFGLIVPAKK